MTIKKVLFSLFITISIINSASSQDEEIVARFEARTHTYSDIALPYRLFIPGDYDTLNFYPMVLVLHGAGERGDDNLIHIQRHRMATSWADSMNQQKYPCFVVAPQCPSNYTWVSPIRMPEACISLIDSMINEFSIDENRIYVSGLSMGGQGTWYLIHNYPERFAAAIPMSGIGYPEEVETIKHIPVWNFHGQEDNTVSVHYSRIIMEAMEELGYQVVYTHSHYRDNTGLTDTTINMYVNAHHNILYTEYEDKGHVIWAESYDYPFLFPWVFSKYKIETDAIELLNLTGYQTLTGIDTIRWNAINPEDSVEIWYSPDNGQHWQLFTRSSVNSGNFIWDTEDIPDCFPGFIKIFLKNSNGFIYGFDKSSMFSIDNQENGQPYIKILNNDFVVNTEISEPEIDLKLLIGDAEEDSLDIFLYYSVDDGMTYARFDSFKTITDPNYRLRPVSLSLLDYSENARIKAIVYDCNSTCSDSTYFFRNAAGTVYVISKDIIVPGEFVLYQNYPNPFNS